MKTVKLFVYGTLKSGGALNGWMERSQLLGTAMLMGYALVNIDEVVEEPHPSKRKRRASTIYQFPAMIEGGSPEHIVEGEVYEVPEHEFQMLRGMEERAGYLTTRLSQEEGDSIHYFVLPAAKECPRGTYSWDVAQRKVVFTPKAEGCGCEEPQCGSS